jgi:hypothetical protein
MNAIECSVCRVDFTEDEGGTEGLIGVIPANFCPTCLAGVYDMVEQSTDKPEWESLTDEEISASSKGHMTRNGFARTIEAKLKEKNS